MSSIYESSTTGFLNSVKLRYAAYSAFEKGLQQIKSNFDSGNVPVLSTEQLVCISRLKVHQQVNTIPELEPTYCCVSRVCGCECPTQVPSLLLLRILCSCRI